MTSFFRKLSWLARRREKETELADEIRFHLEEETEERQADGLSGDEAKWAARRELGNVALLQESTRAAWGWTLIEQFRQDLRYGLRAIAANKAFSLLAILSLALGIGANTAIYSFMDSLLLRSLPVRDPQSLVVLNWHARPARMRDFVMHSMSGHTWRDHGQNEAGIFPFPAFELLRKNDAVFSSLFGYFPARELNLTSKGQSDVAKGEYVSGDYFRGLEVPPAAGRLIFADDDRAGATSVAVVSGAYSEAHYGSAANAVGQPISINNIPFTIVGVTPPEFFGVDPGVAPQIYLPMHSNILVEAADSHGEDLAKRYFDGSNYWIEMMGRLRPGVSRAEARAALAPQFEQWARTTAQNDRERANLPVLVLEEGAGGLKNLRREYSQPLYVLMTMVGLILAIACANVANLLLARAAARRKEIALRLSVGAGRFRVVRQLLTESVLLASLGGALGVLFAIWGMRFLAALLAGGDPAWILSAQLNWRVLAVAVALSVLTGIFFGLAPAMQSTRLDVISAIKETQAIGFGSNKHGGRRGLARLSLSHALVVAQIGFSLLMLVAAGLFVRTLRNLESIELGFNRENMLLFELNARKAGHQDPELEAFYGDLLNRFAAIPGVRNASLSNSPLIEAGHGTDIHLPGKPDDEETRYLLIGPAFFTTMQIQILAGRGIEDRDHAGSPGVVVINEIFAKKNFGDENPLGQHVEIGWPKSRDAVIVGVSINARYGGLTQEIPPVVYIPYDQGYQPPREMTYVLRTAGDPLTLANTIREIVRKADERVPVTGLKTQAAEIDESMNQEIVFAELCSALAILALTIACVGLYGTVSYSVARRTGEIGIRMALGARRGNVVWMVLRGVIALAAVGLAISIPAALGTSKFVASFLYGMKPNDPMTVGIAIAILLGAALVAGYVPARRASRIDPMVALRHE
jgi:macrolide transport system ATP-binding/permease protein